jgi:hypothetical protein
VRYIHQQGGAALCDGLRDDPAESSRILKTTSSVADGPHVACEHVVAVGGWWWWWWWWWLAGR